MDTFFICDLSHTSQKINSEYIPYAIGCLKSFFHDHGEHEADIHLIKYPEKLSPKFFEHRPSIVAFSNYMWNSDLGYSFAQAIKKQAPETLIVFGSRDYPLETSNQKKWFEEHPAVDIYIIGEAEKPFQEVADLWIETRSIEAIKKAKIDGLHSLVNGNVHKTGKIRKDGYDEEPRIHELTEFSSPYLMGYLDEFLLDPNLSPLIETNRGCPFQCTFCVDGVGSRNQIYKGSAQRSEQELVYIAERHRGKYLQLADVNFGMYREDIEFSKVLAEIKKKYDFPHHIQVCAGKNQQERIIECGEILEGSLRFGASIQSMDEEVLSNIKRSNISYEKLIEVSQRVSNTATSTYSEVILALPGDSKEKHLNSFEGVITAGINKVFALTLIMLEGSELATVQQREKFNMKSRFRATHRSFGVYEFNGVEFPSVEIEEVCVENDSLPFEDYVECRRFALTTTLFYNDKAFFELGQFIISKGFKVYDWLVFVHDNIDKAPEKLREVYAQFTTETIEELDQSKQDLEDRIKNNPEIMESYIKGERGNNVLYNSLAKVQIEAMVEMHQVAFESAREFMRVRNIELSLVNHSYLENLERYCLAKRREFIDFDSIFLEEFDFDFISLEECFFENTPDEQSPNQVKFYYEDWQKDFFRDNIRRQGTNIQSMGKFFSRIPIKKLQRFVAREGDILENVMHSSPVNSHFSEE